MQVYINLFHQRNFSLMMFADAVSVLGNQIGWVALLWFAMVTVKHPADMGLLALAFGVPGVFLGPVVGNVLDTVSHKAALLTANLLLGVVFMFIPLLYALHALSMFVLLMLVLLVGGISSFTTVGWMVLLPNLVNDRELGSANAVGETVWNAAMLLGPLLSGLMIAKWGAQVAVLFDGVSFWLAAVFIAFIRYTPSVNELSGMTTRQGSFWQDTWSGLKLLYEMQGVWWITLAALAINLAEGQLEVSLPLLTHREFSMSAIVLGSFWGVYFGLSLLGAVIAGLLRLKNQGQAFVMSMAFVGWGLSFVPLFYLKSELVVYMCMAFSGFLFGGYPLLARTAVQKMVPKNYHGRIMGIRGSLIAVGPPIGAYMGGLLGNWVSASNAIGMTGVAVAAIGVVLLTRRGFREI
ncbi:MFS transporter [Alicyclobacillus sp. SO9]|uniref:MFS transporter n=1 Tax=Alicyclobacillus sp. SO9 TaxID=2665646 RepID=UPI0018E89C55|nr:MFS transporter [Alicyclobacillus sp. SO9]QQE77101.1 MFS transporter [Alicyclobacillus sp. SO9]